MADISNFSIEFVSNNIFAWKISKDSSFGISWKNRCGFGKKTWIFSQNRLIWQVWYTIRLKLIFYSRILETFRFWILSEKSLEFFKNAKVQRKLRASRIVLMLKGSQTFKFGFFGKKRCFSWKKSLIFSKLANFGKFFLECIWKRYLGKKTFWNLSKTLNFASFFLKCVSQFTYAHVFWRRSKRWVFGKRDVFLRENTWKFSKTLNTNAFLQNVFQKLWLLVGTENVQQLEISGNVDGWFRKAAEYFWYWLILAIFL